MSEHAPRLRIELLGRFRISVDGRPVDAARFPGRRAAELIQLLALSTGHTLPREQVIDALWPHLDADAAAANLRKAAHHARHALGVRDAVVLHAGTVTLAGNVETDVARFEASARRAIGRNDRAGAAEAAASYGGTLLPESFYEPWTEVPRKRLEALHVDLLRLARRWEELVAVDPLDERAYCELMRQSLEARNRPAAIRWFGRLRAALASELGIAPGAETEALYEKCVVGLRQAEPTLVGRHAELAAIVAALDDTKSVVSAFAVRGPAGVGKSALCRAIASRAEGEGWKTITLTNGMPADAYAALVEVTEQLVHHDRARFEALPAQARSVLAALTRRVSPAPAIEGPVTRHRVIGAFRLLLQAFEGESGLVLVVDDADLLDEATTDVLFNVCGPEGATTRVVFAYRAERAHELLRQGMARLARAGRLLSIDLGPLEREDAVALATAEAPDGSGAAIAARVAELAEGNPFFVRELARSAKKGEIAIASTVWDAIRARFVDLDAGSVEMVSRLALAGDPLETGEIVAITGLPEAEAFALLDASLGAGILVVSDARYRFRHALVRQALVERVPPHRRIAVHRDAARRLAEAGGPSARIARHWIDGGRPEEARPWLLDAARRAMRLGAFADSLHHLDALLEQAPDDVEALALRARALDAMGDSRAIAAYAAAVSRADAEQAHELRPMQALAQLKAGDPKGALETLEGTSPTTLLAQVSRALTISGTAAIGAGDRDAAPAAAAEARRLALAAGDPGAVVEASWAQSLAAHANGELPAQLRADLVSTHHLPELAVRVFDGHLCATERLLYGSRPYSEVIDFAGSLASESERLGAGRGRAFAVTLRGEAKLLSGDLDEAERDLSEGARLHRTIGAPAGRALALQRLAEVALYRGRRDDALGLLERALAAARESYLGHHLFDRIYGARIAASEGAADEMALVEEAMHAVRGPVETCPTCHITLVVPAAIAAARCGDLERAEHHAKAAEMLCDVILHLPAWSAALHEIRGHIARSAGDPHAARERFAQAAEAYGRCGHPLDQARCARLI